MAKKNYPDVAEHNPSPLYVKELMSLSRSMHGITSVQKLADRIGVGKRTLTDWASGKSSIPYCAQYTLESLADIHCKDIEIPAMYRVEYISNKPLQ